MPLLNVGCYYKMSLCIDYRFCWSLAVNLFHMSTCFWLGKLLSEYNDFLFKPKTKYGRHIQLK